MIGGPAAVAARKGNLAWAGCFFCPLLVWRHRCGSAQVSALALALSISMRSARMSGRVERERESAISEDGVLNVGMMPQ